MQPEDHGSEGHFGSGRLQRGQAGGGTKASADGKESQAAGEKVKISYLSRFYESGAAACQVLHGEAGGIPGG